MSSIQCEDGRLPGCQLPVCRRSDLQIRSSRVTSSPRVLEWRADRSCRYRRYTSTFRPPVLGPSRPAQDSLSTSDLRRSAHSEEAVLRHRHRTRQPLRDHFSRPWRTIAHRKPGSPTHRPHSCHSSQTERTTWPRKWTESRQVEAQFGFSFSPVMLLAILGSIEIAWDPPTRPWFPTR